MLSFDLAAQRALATELQHEFSLVFLPFSHSLSLSLTHTHTRKCRCHPKISSKCMTLLWSKCNKVSKTTNLWSQSKHFSNSSELCKSTWRRILSHQSGFMYTLYASLTATTDAAVIQNTHSAQPEEPLNLHANSSRSRNHLEKK